MVLKMSVGYIDLEDLTADVFRHGNLRFLTGTVQFFVPMSKNVIRSSHASQIYSTPHMEAALVRVSAECGHEFALISGTSLMQTYKSSHGTLVIKRDLKWHRVRFTYLVSASGVCHKTFVALRRLKRCAICACKLRPICSCCTFFIGVAHKTCAWDCMCAIRAHQGCIGPTPTPTLGCPTCYD